MKGYIPLLSLLLSLISCSHVPFWKDETKKPAQVVKPDLEKRPSVEKIIERYKQIESVEKNFADTSRCTKIKKISRPLPKIPYKHFFLMKEWRWCDQTKEGFEKDYKSLLPLTPGWLKRDFLNKSLSKASSLGLKTLEISLIKKLIKISKQKSEKLKLINRALKLEPENKNFISLRLNVAPRFNKKITNLNAYRVGRDFERERQFKKSREIYNKIIKAKNSSIEMKIKAWKRVKASYKNQRNEKKYISKIKEMSRFLKRRIKGSSDKALIEKEWWKNEIMYARAIWTIHDRKKAIKILKNLLIKKNIPPNQKSYALFLLSSIEVEKKDYKKSLNYLLKANKVKKIKEDLKNKIIWSIGWNYFLLNQFEKSANYFKKEKEKVNSYYLKLKLSFWESISYEKLGLLKKAEKAWLDLYKEAPFTYYGVVSQLKLNKPFIPISRIQKKNSYNIKNIDPIFYFIKKTNHTKHAKTYLKSKVRKIKAIKELKELIPFFNSIGWHQGIFHKFYSIDPKTRAPHTEDFFHNLFPTPFEDSINKVSKKYNIEPEIIYSITRQESAFELYSRSHAEAYGPMQITPENAKRLARRYKIPYKKAKDLFKPQINFALGSALIKGLQEKFNQQFIFYIAAYNANNASVKRWTEERYDGDVFKFIELIPYNETKNYVMLVLRNYINYKRVTNKKPFYFPRDIL
ncbi:MAG: hypothetical protein CME68_02940 [Halobacteriovoraceae bacterium]|nr:hypothetical protein [Halobacteriovoraceae bacterium]